MSDISQGKSFKVLETSQDFNASFNEFLTKLVLGLKKNSARVKQRTYLRSFNVIRRLL